MMMRVVVFIVPENWNFMFQNPINIIFQTVRRETLNRDISGVSKIAVQK